jgi:phytoene dehydrogenase-like protein
MAKVIVIGSGVAGLTAAAYLQEAGHSVKVFEQFQHIGGVTATVEQDGFSWDLGPMLLEGFGPGEPAGVILEELGVANQLHLQREERGLVFPDFSIWRQPEYKGPYWRKELLKEIFPAESEGLDSYYRFYDQMMDLMALVWRAEKSGGLKSKLLTAKAWLTYQKVKKMADWPASRLMDTYFKGPELKALFTAILADFVVPPSQFSALAVPAINVETPFDKRMPLQVSKAGPRPSYHYVLGGCQKLVDVLANKIRTLGGEIHAGSPVTKIDITEGRINGVYLENDAFEAADLVIASGGVKEIMFDVVGREHLPDDFVAKVNDVPLMESVHMIHLGVDYDTLAHQPGALCYYYQTYDIEDAVKRCQEKSYHEGKDGFLVYVPSLHTPEMAPEGLHAVTIYTIAPNQLDRGDWSSRGEELSDKLIAETEQYLPGLTQKVKTKIVLTPDDFQKRTHLQHHAFGGRAPVMGTSGGPHRTPVDGLWFIGSQSEKVGGGVSGTMAASKKVFSLIQKEIKT